MNKSLKQIYENTNKQWKEMNKTVKDLKVERESLKKTHSEEIEKFRTSSRTAIVLNH